MYQYIMNPLLLNYDIQLFCHPLFKILQFSHHQIYMHDLQQINNIYYYFTIHVNHVHKMLHLMEIQSFSFVMVYSIFQHLKQYKIMLILILVHLFQIIILNFQMQILNVIYISQYLQHLVFRYLNIHNLYKFQLFIQF